MAEIPVDDDERLRWRAADFRSLESIRDEHRQFADETRRDRKRLGDGIHSLEEKVGEVRLAIVKVEREVALARDDAATAKEGIFGPNRTLDGGLKAEVSNLRNEVKEMIQQRETAALQSNKRLRTWNAILATVGTMMTILAALERIGVFK